jgi:hypothetical protein
VSKSGNRNGKIERGEGRREREREIMNVTQHVNLLNLYFAHKSAFFPPISPFLLGTRAEPLLASPCLLFLPQKTPTESNPDSTSL